MEILVSEPELEGSGPGQGGKGRVPTCLGRGEGRQAGLDAGSPMAGASATLHPRSPGSEDCNPPSLGAGSPPPGLVC